MATQALALYDDLDLDAIEADFTELVDAETEKIGPTPPYWYKEERSLPDLTEITDWAQSERTDHTFRVIQAALFESRVGLETSAIFDRDVDWVEIGEIEQWVSPLLRNEHDGLISFIESQLIQPRARTRALHLREEASAAEDYVNECFDDWQRSSIISGNGTLLSSLAYDATVHAMWSIYLAPDPGNVRTGQRYRRVDPKIVYPIFEGDRGCGHVFTVAETEAKDMLGWYGDGGGPVTRKIKDVAKSGTHDSRINLHASHEMITYHNRTWGVIIWGGAIIKKWKHRMWRVPWVIIPFAWRQQMSSVSVGHNFLQSMWGEPMAPDDQGILGIASLKQRDYARVYEPFLANRLPLHDQMEKIGSRLLTNMRSSRNPALVWQKPMQHGTKPRPAIENWEGGITEIPESLTGKAIDVLPVLPLAEVMEPLMQFITTGLQAGVPLPLLQGASIGAQSSGSAIDVLLQTGWDKWVPVARGATAGLTEIGHTLLLNVKEFGDSLGEGVSGILDVPRRVPDKYGISETHQLTQEMVERLGCYIDVGLSRFNLNGILQAATALATIRTQVGVMSKREAIEFLGYTSNIERSIQERNDEDLEETPGVLEAMTIEHLYEQLYMAYVSGDMESVRRLGIRGKRVAARQKLADLQLAMAAGMGGMEQPAPIEEGGMEPGGAGAPFLPPGDLGNEVGVEGGRQALAAGTGVM